MLNMCYDNFRILEVIYNYFFAGWFLLYIANYFCCTFAQLFYIPIHIIPLRSCPSWSGPQWIYKIRQWWPSGALAVRPALFGCLQRLQNFLRLPPPRSMWPVLHQQGHPFLLSQGLWGFPAPSDGSLCVFSLQGG